MKIVGLRIRKVISHPTEHSCVISSMQGNNEISMWNLETGFRQTTLWGSNTPPFSKTNVSFVLFYTFLLNNYFLNLMVWYNYQE